MYVGDKLTIAEWSGKGCMINTPQMLTALDMYSYQIRKGGCPGVDRPGLCKRTGIQEIYALNCGARAQRSYFIICAQLCAVSDR